MELYKGLPLRTIEAVNLEDKDCIFGITTETVNDLIEGFPYLDVHEDIKHFDNAYMYAVPQNIFENTNDEDLIRYINENIDNNYKL